jgi:hypothetical protein
MASNRRLLDAASSSGETLYLAFQRTRSRAEKILRATEARTAKKQEASKRENTSDATANFDF